MKAIAQYKDLLYFLTVKELKLKYKNSVLGITWSLFNPLMMIINYTIAFKIILRIEIGNYSVFVFTGLLPWIFFQNTVNQAASSLISHSSLISKVYFPKSIIPLSIILSNFISFLITLLVLFATLIFFDIPFTYYLLLLPILFLFILAFVTGFSLIITSINTKYRDVAYLMEVVFTAWFYLTPIIYPLSMVPEELKIYFLFNPVTSMVESMRSIMIQGELPSLLNIGIVAVSSILVLIIGTVVFKARERKFIDEL